MRAHQIMTRNTLTVLPETSILEAARKMLENHVSGLPVLDASGKLVGIVSESDFLRRSEIGTQQKRPRWLQYFLSPAHSANDFIHERGRKVEDVMTRDPVVADEGTSLDELVHLMEKNGIKRLPVVRDDKLVGIITRANLLQAVASMAKEIPDPRPYPRSNHPDPGSHRLAANRASGRRPQRRRSPARPYHQRRQRAPGFDRRGGKHRGRQGGARSSLLCRQLVRLLHGIA